MRIVKYFLTFLLLYSSLMVNAQADTAAKLAPNFTLPGSDGKNHRLSEYRGRLVLLSFWADWCGPCKQQLGQLNKLNERFADGLTVFAINIDKKSAQPEVARQQALLSYPLLRDSEQGVAELYDIDDLPALVLIDQDGVVQLMLQGAAADSRKLTSKIENLQAR